MVERRVRWGRTIDTGDQIRMRFRYTVAIVNVPRQITRIKDRFLEQMAPSDEVHEVCDYTIPGSGGIHCMIFSFSSTRFHIEDSDKIYKRPEEFRHDRDLFERDEVDMIPYIERLIGS